MKSRIDELRSKIVLVSALTRAASEKAARMPADPALEQLQALAAMAEDAASQALTEVTALLASLSR